MDLGYWHRLRESADGTKVNLDRAIPVPFSGSWRSPVSAVLFPGAGVHKDPKKMRDQYTGTATGSPSVL
jgi:hypothetical protein